MNRDDITRMAREANVWIVGRDPYPAQLERFAKLIEQHLYYDGIHTCHAECQRPSCVAIREEVKAERDRCILMLERLHEQVGDRHNYYAYAAKVLKGEI